MCHFGPSLILILSNCQTSRENFSFRLYGIVTKEYGTFPCFIFITYCFGYHLITCKSRSSSSILHIDIRKIPDRILEKPFRSHIFGESKRLENSSIIKSTDKKQYLTPALCASNRSRFSRSVVVGASTSLPGQRMRQCLSVVHKQPNNVDVFRFRQAQLSSRQSNCLSIASSFIRT